MGTCSQFQPARLKHGDLWFSALTHGNSASVCLQAFSLMGCGYELLKLEEKLETRLSTRDMEGGSARAALAAFTAPSAIAPLQRFSPP